MQRKPKITVKNMLKQGGTPSTFIQLDAVVAAAASAAAVVEKRKLIVTTPNRKRG